MRNKRMIAAYDGNAAVNYKDGRVFVFNLLVDTGDVESVVVNKAVYELK